MKNLIMALRKNWIRLILFQLSGLLFFCGNTAGVPFSITLYTPYTKISVPPGESIDYSIDIINSSSEIQNVEISVSGLPNGWNYILKSGGWKISQISILPGEKTEAFSQYKCSPAS